MNPNGVLICSVPYCIDDVLAEMLHGASNPYHLQRFTPQTMRNLLSTDFAILAEWGQKFHTIGHYFYVFANYLVWQFLNDLPWLGRFLLDRRENRNKRILHDSSRMDFERQLNYGLWREDEIPLEWKLELIESEVKRIPETLIYIVRKL